MISLYRLPDQERGETLQLFVRRHWIAVAGIFGYVLVFSVAPLLLYLIIRLTDSNVLHHEFWGPVSAVLFSVYLMVVFLVSVTQFTDHYLDNWIVTTERIINIEQQGLFSRVVSTLHLNQIQDVTSETKGFFATILNYGNVYIQTAGTRERFNFKAVHDPEEIKQAIIHLVEDDKRRHGDDSKPDAPYGVPQQYR